MTTPPPQYPDNSNNNSNFQGLGQSQQPGGQYQYQQPNAPYNPGQPMPSDLGPSAYPAGGNKPKKGIIIGSIIGVVGVLLIILVIVLVKGNGDGVERSKYQSGVEKILSEAMEGQMDSSHVTEIAKCITDRTFDDVSEETRELISSGKDILPGQENFDIITGSSMECTMEILRP